MKLIYGLTKSRRLKDFIWSIMNSQTKAILLKALGEKQAKKKNPELKSANKYYN